MSNQIGGTNNTLVNGNQENNVYNVYSAGDYAALKERYNELIAAQWYFHENERNEEIKNVKEALKKMEAAMAKGGN